MRSMNRRESSLPPERLKEMAEKEGRTTTRSTDEFAAREPKLTKFSPDFSPIDEPKRQTGPHRSAGQAGRRRVGQPPVGRGRRAVLGQHPERRRGGRLRRGRHGRGAKASSRPAEREQEPVSRDRSTAFGAARRRRTRPAADPNAAHRAGAAARSVRPNVPARPNPAPAAACRVRPGRSRGAGSQQRPGPVGAARSARSQPATVGVPRRTSGRAAAPGTDHRPSRPHRRSPRRPPT